MPPPSPLAIATSALQRLVKEEASYHKEQQHQEARIAKLEAETGPDEDGNRDYMIKQEKRAIEETKAVFPSLNAQISAAIAKVEEQIDAESQKGDGSNAEQIAKAKDTIATAKTSINGSS